MAGTTKISMRRKSKMKKRKINLLNKMGNTYYGKFLEQEIYRIGRGKKNDIKVYDGAVSEYHCVIINKEEGGSTDNR